MFSKASGGNYLRSECKPCSKNLGEARDKAKISAPHITKNHKCPICDRSETEVRGKGGKKSGAWCCDHDHIAGNFRGWLCHDCNRGLGNFKDDINKLKSAIEYLEKNKKDHKLDNAI
jgi:hypothetical protein